MRGGREGRSIEESIGKNVVSRKEIVYSFKSCPFLGSYWRFGPLSHSSHPRTVGALGWSIQGQPFILPPQLFTLRAGTSAMTAAQFPPRSRTCTSQQTQSMA